LDLKGQATQFLQEEVSCCSKAGIAGLGTFKMPVRFTYMLPWVLSVKIAICNVEALYFLHFPVFGVKERGFSEVFFP
jgi:hypothetical protein